MIHIITENKYLSLGLCFALSECKKDIKVYSSSRAFTEPVHEDDILFFHSSEVMYPCDFKHVVYLVKSPPSKLVDSNISFIDLNWSMDKICSVTSGILAERESILCNPLLFSESECFCVCMVLSGVSPNVLSDDIRISSRTINRHIRSAMKKSGISNRSDLRYLKHFFSHQLFQFQSKKTQVLKQEKTLNQPVE